MTGARHVAGAGDTSARARPIRGDYGNAWRQASRSHPSAAETIVEHVRERLERGELRPGDRLPPERALAVQTGVSRSSVRVGLRALSTMGIIQSRHGSGTFIADGPPTLETEPLHFLAALHGFTRDQMFEARRMIEVGVAGLSATRATGEQIAAMAEEVTSMFASLDIPQDFLRHDIRFHQAVAAACGNPILTSLVEMLSQVFYEGRRATVARARDLRESAEMHRRIYMAIRQRDAALARESMDRHLQLSYEAQASEERTPQGEAALSNA
jgi:GntR family transcriptional regulator, transcriptional repressor for pyruvate dehydrogenase complex